MLTNTWCRITIHSSMLPRVGTAPGALPFPLFVASQKITAESDLENWSWHLAEIWLHEAPYDSCKNETLSARLEGSASDALIFPEMNVECSGVEGSGGEEIPHSSMIENEEKVEIRSRINPSIRLV